MANTHNTSRGFAGMDEDKQREIASKGGRSVAPENRSFSRNHDLAAQAGRKGGENSHGGRNSGNFADDRERASEAGRKGGMASHGGRTQDLDW